jgi:hypothetical protein
MSEIELLMIGVSMILAAGIVRCLEGLYHATISPQRYWIPQVLLWSTFIYGVNFLWAFKNNLSDENPSYIFYAGSILLASTFVLRTHVLATKDASQVQDWRRHFEETARPYFVFAVLTSFFSLVVLWAADESSGIDAVSIPFWLGMALNATGAIFKANRVRSVVAVIHVTLVVVASLILFTNELI